MAATTQWFYSHSPRYNLECYPQEVGLLDGTVVTLRPMKVGDEKALLDFFRALPADDVFYLKEDVTSEAVIHRWAADLDYDRALPLLAFVGERVVADATLLRSRSGARQHVGELRIIVHPWYRNLGLGTVMMHHLMSIANEAGLEVLSFEAVRGKHDEAIRSAQWLGFSHVAVLKGRAKEGKGRYHDVVVTEALLGKWFWWWPFRVAVSEVHVRFPW